MLFSTRLVAVRANSLFRAESLSNEHDRSQRQGATKTILLARRANDHGDSDKRNERSTDGNILPFTSGLPIQIANKTFGHESRHMKQLVSRAIIEDGPRYIDNYGSIASRRAGVTIAGMYGPTAIFLFGTQFTIGLTCIDGEEYDVLNQVIANMARTEQNIVTQVRILVSSSPLDDNSRIHRNLRRVKRLVQNELGVVPMSLAYPYEIEWIIANWTPEYDWTGDRQGRIIQRYRAPQLNPAEHAEEDYHDRIVLDEYGFPVWTYSETMILEDNMFQPL